MWERLHLRRRQGCVTVHMEIGQFQAGQIIISTEYRGTLTVES